MPAAGLDSGAMATNDPQREPGPRDGGAPLDRFLRTYVEDSTLWPVLAVAALILASCGAALLLLALVDRNPFAGAALLVLVWMSGDVLRGDLRRRRLGATGGVVLGLWALAAAVAAAGAWLGVV